MCCTGGIRKLLDSSSTPGFNNIFNSNNDLDSSGNSFTGFSSALQNSNGLQSSGNRGFQQNSGSGAQGFNNIFMNNMPTGETCS